MNTLIASPSNVSVPPDLGVVEAARVLPPSANLDNVHFINHGGLAVISKPGTIIAKVDTKLKLTSFEFLCCRVASGPAPPLFVVTIYRPGSLGVREQFFTNFSALLESLATFNCEIVIVGDLNIHLERPTETESTRLE